MMHARAFTAAFLALSITGYSAAQTVRCTTWNLEWFPNGSAHEASAEQQNQRIKRANIYERTLVKLMKSFSWTQRVSRSRQSIHGKTDEQSSLAGCIIARINSEKF